MSDLDIENTRRLMDGDDIRNLVGEANKLNDTISFENKQLKDAKIRMEVLGRTIDENNCKRDEFKSTALRVIDKL